MNVKLCLLNQETELNKVAKDKNLMQHKNRKFNDHHIAVLCMKMMQHKPSCCKFIRMSPYDHLLAAES